MDTTTPRVLASCSFCMKANTDVGKLIAGPGVYICNECVGLCEELLALPAGGARLAPWERETSSEELLRLLPQVAAAAAQVDEALTGYVAQAREHGISWARIGKALGITRQSAWERFSED